MAQSKKTRWLTSLALLIGGLAFGYYLSLQEGWIYLTAISAGMLLGLTLGLKYSWWLVTGVFLGSLPIMLMRCLILYNIKQISLLQFLVMMTILPLFAAGGAWFGQSLRKPRISQ